MKITVLMENTALEGCGLTPEHGLSLYIEHRGRKLLLDAGSSGKFADNARALGVDLSAVELAALSHGHYDHADGLRRFFQVNDRAKVYVRPGAAGPYFAKDPDAYRFIGIGRDIWENSRNRFVEVEGVYPLTEGGWLVPRPSATPPSPARPPICSSSGGGRLCPRRLPPRAVPGAGGREGVDSP